MSRDKQLTAREIRRASDRMRGVVASAPTLKFFDPTGAASPTWVVDVDVGAEKLLRDVLVKLANERGGGRGYAREGAPVFLERDARGRWQVIGPGDRVPAQGNITLLDETTDAGSAGGLTGFTFLREVFDFYKGAAPESFFDPGADADTLVWLRAYGSSNRVVDGSSNITQLTDASGSNNHATETGASLNPQLVSSVSQNGRDGADFNGSSDRMTFAANIAGQVISIFAAVNKDAAGAGDDTIVQTAEYRLQSREIGAGDFWGVDAGGGFNDSGSTIGSGVVLVEAICTAFNDIDLYENGVFLGNFTLAAAGEGVATSRLGNSFGTGQTHNGKIIELLILDRAVNATDRVAIENYFNQTLTVNFSLWNDGVTPFPKFTVLDAQGVPI